MSDITFSTHRDPSTSTRHYSAAVPEHVILQKLEVDLWREVICTIGKNAAFDILQTHGEDLLNRIMKQDAEIRDKVVNTICKNIEWFIHELMISQRNFENKELCQCKQVHGFGLKPPVKFDHLFVAMSNLEYLEYRYDRVKEWVKGLRYE